MPLLALATLLLLFGVYFAFLLRGVGGWLQVNRSRRGLPTHEPTQRWAELPTAILWWFFGIPILFGLAIVLGLIGTVSVWGSSG